MSKKSEIKTGALEKLARSVTGQVRKGHTTGSWGIDGRRCGQEE